VDIVSHALWTNILYLKARRHALWGVACGILPDIVSFGPLYLQLIFFPEDAPSIEWARRDAGQIPAYVFTLYDWSHSLVIFSGVLLAARVAARRIWWPMFGWGFHVLIDMFTHTSAFFPTPFLWPIADAHDTSIDAVSWSHPIFIAANVSALVVAYIALFVLHRRSTMGGPSASRTYDKTH